MSTQKEVPHSCGVSAGWTLESSGVWINVWPDAGKWKIWTWSMKCEWKSNMWAKRRHLFFLIFFVMISSWWNSCFSKAFFYIKGGCFTGNLGLPKHMSFFPELCLGWCFLHKWLNHRPGCHFTRGFNEVIWMPSKVASWSESKNNDRWQSYWCEGSGGSGGSFVNPRNGRSFRLTTQTHTHREKYLQKKTSNFNKCMMQNSCIKH